MYNDEFTGQGGSYMQDPKTGVRTRVEEPTEHPREDASLLDNSAVESKPKKISLTNAAQGE